MKYKVSALLTILFFFLILLFPKECVTGASKGLVLWFDVVLPTLLPFMILSNLLLATHAVDLISRITRPAFSRFFHVSSYGSFVILTGFLCGYPMGSKLASDLLGEQKISYQEAFYLLSFCNNTSPMFIISFLLIQNLKASALAIPSLVILMVTPILCSFLFRKISIPCRLKNKVPVTTTDLGQIKGCGLLDRCIMDGFETITKIGGYMMLFAILIELGHLIPSLTPELYTVLLSPLEMTTGIASICQSSFSFPCKYVLSLALTSFGGVCCLVQTKCMIQKSGLPITPYIIQKLITAGVTSLLAVCYLFFFH